MNRRAVLAASTATAAAVTTANAATEGPFDETGVPLSPSEPPWPTACAPMSRAMSGAVWAGADPTEDGVRCYSPQGELLGKIHTPQTVANLVFGGLLRNRLCICASTSLYACYVNTQGALKP